MQISWGRVLITVSLIIGVAILSFFFIAGYLTLGHLGSLLVSLVGTFVGAWLAFARDRSKDKLEQARKKNDIQQALDTKRRAAINRALFVLGGQQNEINQLYHAIRPYEKVALRQFRTPALESPGGIISRTQQSFDDLFFLVDLGHPELLFDLMLEQSRFDSAIYVYNKRMSYHLDVLQPAIEAAGPVNDGKIAIPDLEALLGPRVFYTALKHSDGMFKQISDARVSLAKVQTRLIDASEALYPQHRFVRFVPIEGLLPPLEPMPPRDHSVDSPVDRPQQP